MIPAPSRRFLPACAAPASLPCKNAVSDTAFQTVSLTASFVSRELYPYLYPYKTITFGVKMKLLSPELIDFTTFPNKLALSNIVQIPASPPYKERCVYENTAFFSFPSCPYLSVANPFWNRISTRQITTQMASAAMWITFCGALYHTLTRIWFIW